MKFKLGSLFMAVLIVLTFTLGAWGSGGWFADSVPLGGLTGFGAMAARSTATSIYTLGIVGTGSFAERSSERFCIHSLSEDGSIGFYYPDCGEADSCDSSIGYAYRINLTFAYTGGSLDAYVRFRSNADLPGTLKINSAEIHIASDGYYYYPNALAPGDRLNLVYTIFAGTGSRDLSRILTPEIIQADNYASAIYWDVIIAGGRIYNLSGAEIARDLQRQGFDIAQADREGEPDAYPPNDDDETEDDEEDIDDDDYPGQPANGADEDITDDGGGSFDFGSGEEDFTDGMSGSDLDEQPSAGDDQDV